jgi:hypothetical protein
MFQSYYSSLFVSLKTRIQQAVPEILLVDPDWRQIDNYDTAPAVSWPCLLIDFTPSDFTNESNMTQWSDVTVQLRLAFAPVVAPDTVSGKTLEFYELEAKLYKALQGWQPVDEDDNAIGGPLIRLQALTEDRDDHIRVRRILFATAFEDDSAMPVYNNAAADLDPDTI